MEVGRERLRLLGRAVREEDLLHAVVRQEARRQLDRLPGAEEEDLALGDRLEDASHEGEGDAGNRDGARPERRLGPDPLAALERRLEEPARDGAGRPRLGGAAVGLADLPQDLRLAEDHRVEAGGDAEEVAHGRLAAPGERLLAEDGGVDGVEAREEGREGLEAVGHVADAVDLGPVARRDDGPFGQDVLAEEPLQRFARRLGREGEPRPQVEVRPLVVPADEDDLGRHQVNEWTFEKKRLTAV